MRPRPDKISVPLPEDKDLHSDILQALKGMPALNNLRMFANVPSCFIAIKSLIDKLFNHGNLDPKLREYMYLRISFSCGVFYEFRHNRLFAEHLGISNEEIAILAKPEEVTQLGEEGNLVCKAAEEITDNISISDATLKSLLERFGKGTTAR